MQNIVPCMFAAASRAAAVLTAAFLFTAAVPDAHAATVNITPTINEISINVEGQLVASGNVTAEIDGEVTTADFTDVPVNLSLADDQTGAGACPILDLALDPIHLNLLGLDVKTSAICLKITAYDGGGLLGDLLCNVSGLLGGGLSLDDILGGLTDTELNDLLDGVEDLLNAALGNLLDAIADRVQEIRGNGRFCSILHLELGPIDLTLLGLNVHLDNCDDGPVKVKIRGERGELLGDLLCGLLGGGSISLGTTLGELLDSLLGALNP